MTAMMKGLLALLTLQVLLSAGLWYGKYSANSGEAPAPLLAANIEAVNRIVIASADDSISLMRDSEQWYIDALDGLPADASKIADVLAKLEAIEGGWPVATTKSSHTRFEVADDKFQRKLSLMRGETTMAELFLGTSPGFKKIHARAAGQDAVHAVALSSYELPAAKAEWLDRELLAVEPVSAVRSTAFSVAKLAETWTLEADALPEDFEIDGNKAEELSQVFASLRVTGIADVDTTFESEQGLRFEVDGEGKHVFHFFEQDGQYLVRRNDIDTVFTVSKSQFDSITGLKAIDFALGNGEAEESLDELPDSMLEPVS